jgi:O-antigen ligase
MPTHLRALLVILALAAMVFVFAKAPACAAASTSEDYERRRNLWLAITLTAFLAHDFWIYIIVTAALLLLAMTREVNMIALYFFLLLAVPPFSQKISGLGIMNYFFDITYLRLLALTILLPSFWSMIKRSDPVPFGGSLPDKLILGYLFLNFGLMLTSSSFTNTLRQGVFYGFIDIFLPYYVASRSVKSVVDFRDALMSFVVAALVMSAIGVFEFVRHWLLYANLADAQGIPRDYFSYLERDGSGLRALGSTGHPIAFGYVMAVSLGFIFYLKKSVPNTIVWLLGLAALLAGIIVAFSRGPWVGAAAMLLGFVATGPSPIRRLLKGALFGSIGIAVLLATPLGDKIIDLLPFIGTVEVENVRYRQRLLEIGTSTILQNPFFGGYDLYLSADAGELTQGNGMIDLVNTYLGVGLGTGLVGLSLFVGFFISVAVEIFSCNKNMAEGNVELHLLGRVLLVTLVGILVILFTTSSISVIPVITWSVAGLGAGYARMIARAKATAILPGTASQFSVP